MSDTAGATLGESEIEVKARAKMEQAAENAALLLIVFDVSSPLEDEDRMIIERWRARPLVFVLNKVDLGESWDERRPGMGDEEGKRPAVVRTCGLSGAGIEGLKRVLDERLAEQLPRGQPDGCVVATVRNKDLLVRAKDDISDAMASLRDQSWPEFASSDLGDAVSAFNEILGIEVEVDILDEVFSRFCIGK